MTIHHQQIMIAHAGNHSAASCSGIKRHIFPDRIMMPDDEFAGLSSVFEILWNRPNAREREKSIPFPYRSSALDDHMRSNLASLADSDFRANNGVGSDLHIHVELRLSIN